MPNSYFDQLIEQLKPVIYDSDFDAIFQTLTKDLDGPTRFKLKMELNRLAAPCRRTVDLRNQIDDECFPYEHQGRRHQLDSVAIEIFEKGLETYKGVFTQDTFEQILDADNQLRRAQEEERAYAQSLASQNAEPVSGQSPFRDESNEPYSYLAETFHFGRYPYRSEERMNFTIDVLLTDADEQQFKGVTADISITGMRIRLDEPRDIKTQDQLELSFVGLAKEFTVDPEMRIPYVVVGVQQVDGKQYINLNRASEFRSDELDRFFQRFINGYKKRYRVNIDNTYDSVINKGYEQFFLPRTRQLPVYFSEANKRLIADYVLTTDNNRFVLDTWLNELNQISFGSIFNVRRSQQIFEQLESAGTAQLIILSFSITARGKIYHYSATVDELKRAGLWDTYIAFGRQKASWRVFQVDVRSCNSELAWQPQAVPEHIKVPFRINPPSVEVKQAVKPLKYLAAVSDVTAYVNDLTVGEVNKSQLPSLKAFAHPPAVPLRTKEARLEFVNLRKERRFNYRSRCRVKAGKFVRDAMIIDLSISGLQVQMDTPASISAGDTVYISMTGFLKTYKKAKLSELPYLVASTDRAGTTLRLKADTTAEPHRGSDFIRFLIREQRDVLKLQVENTSVNGLPLCLRNLYCYAPAAVPVFFNRSKQKALSTRRVGVSSWTSGWLSILKRLPGSRDTIINLQPLLRGNSVTEVFEPKLKSMKRDAFPESLLLLIRLYRQNGEYIVQTQWCETHATDDIHGFIDQCLPNSVFRAIAINLSRAGKPDIQFIQAELAYMSYYAAYKAEDLEEELWKIFGVAETIDVTSSLLSFTLPDSASINEQEERLVSWLDKL
ncbi:PilZ domain-containing protein [Idiomarina sp. X4]|uniref:PilZ domain-containing protein n=1 Tax=Idiomarina sp. X4 TaxID=2055892 RepID=UPI000C28459C|nr:PilZ domain-containing protein [Idiomarina sp. X4]ATZ73866.1 PilZ domain-containing protein [Idiomarina sp. X4]